MIKSRIAQRLLGVSFAVVVVSSSRVLASEGAPAPETVASCNLNPASTLFVPATATFGGIVIDGSCEHVYLTNSGQNRVEVFSLQTRTLQAPIQVGSRPAGLDITPDGSLLYVANSGGNNVSVVDLSQRVELRKIPVPAGFSNDTPYSIAIANNGLALFSTTFAGSGFGARMMQLDLATDQVAQRADFWIRGTTTERTPLKASGDRSAIGIVAGDISSGPVFRYDAAANTFSPEKDLAAFISDVSLDRSGATFLVTPGAYVLDASLNVSGTVLVDSGSGTGCAVDPTGTVGYMPVASRVDVLDLSTFLGAGDLPLDDTVGTAGYSSSVGKMDISRDGSLLAVITDHGFSLVPAGGLCSNPPSSNGKACSDGNACTTNDRCMSGECRGGPLLDCDDGDACTADACDSAVGCAHVTANLDAAAGFSAARIDGRDLAVFADAWNSCQGDPRYNPAANLDHASCIDGSDFHLFMSAFGHSCP